MANLPPLQVFSWKWAILLPFVCPCSQVGIWVGQRFLSPRVPIDSSILLPIRMKCPLGIYRG
ncbi:hypothetical protein [Pasteuria penetrans]|uniref:hypothetical protein n=1 Tax=Pasteuria penetrans TaxID=86005 RepID=UPI00165ACA35|nr:hypothetical protein [Pasteuria penetrans]